MRIPRPRLRRLRPAAVLLGAALALTACGGSGPRTGALVTGPAATHPTCRVHQAAMPGHAYTGGSHGTPVAVLTMLRYYTAQGALPFCDGKPATPQDTAWTRLYTGLTRG